MAKKNFYAVKVGKTPGIYKTWDECEANVKEYPGAKYKGFKTLIEAEDYINGESGYNKDFSRITNAEKNLNGDTDVNNNISDDIFGEKKSFVKIIGGDEVGKGEPFRKLIVVLCYVEPMYYEEIKKIGAHRDSKQYGVGTSKCKEIGKKITEKFEFDEFKNGVYENEKYGLTYCVYSISNGKFNKYKSASSNVSGHTILSIMYNRASIMLLDYLKGKGINIEKVVFDNYLGKSSSAFEDKYIKNEEKKITDFLDNVIFETKAENKYLPVGVASNIGSYIESLYIECVREAIKKRGGNLDNHNFSNMPYDVECAYKEVEKIYGDLTSDEALNCFKISAYLDRYLETGTCQ